jgi:hypothetical protein
VFETSALRIRRRPKAGSWTGAPRSGRARSARRAERLSQAARRDRDPWRRPGPRRPRPTGIIPPGEALGGWCLLRSSKPLFGGGCLVEGGFDSHALPPAFALRALRLAKRMGLGLRPRLRRARCDDSHGFRRVGRDASLRAARCGWRSAWVSACALAFGERAATIPMGFGGSGGTPAFALRAAAGEAHGSRLAPSPSASALRRFPWVSAGREGRQPSRCALRPAKRMGLGSSPRPSGERAATIPQRDGAAGRPEWVSGAPGRAGRGLSSLRRLDGEPTVVRADP